MKIGIRLDILAGCLRGVAVVRRDVLCQVLEGKKDELLAITWLLRVSDCWK